MRTTGQKRKRPTSVDGNIGEASAATTLTTSNNNNSTSSSSSRQGRQRLQRGAKDKVYAERLAAGNDNNFDDAINNFNTCGASRFKLTINPSTPVVIRNNLTANNSTFAPILTVNIVSTSSLVIETRYLNSRTVIQN